MILLAKEQPEPLFDLDFFRPFYSSFGYTYYDLLNRSRKLELVMVRSCIIKYMFNHLHYTYIRIGELFERDRTSIMNLNKKTVKYDLTFKHYWEIFEQKLLNNLEKS